MAARFGYDIAKERTSVIVISKGETRLALEVEKISGIKYWEECIREEIPIIAQSDNSCIKQTVSFQGEIILILDLDKIGVV